MKRHEAAAGAAISSVSTTYTHDILGFLDDLKRQAEAARAMNNNDTDALARSAGLADMACKTAFNYLAVLAQHLNVLQTRSKVNFRLDRQQVFEGLQLCGFRADARRKQLRRTEVFDHVVLRWRLTSGTALALTKNFLPDIELLEARLRQGGVTFEAEAVRHPDTAKLQEMRYSFTADFNASVLITPDHDRGCLRFDATNLDGLQSVCLELPAFEIGSGRLDELARWVIGEPNTFLKGAQNLRRSEA